MRCQRQRIAWKVVFTSTSVEKKESWGLPLSLKQLRLDLESLAPRFPICGRINWSTIPPDETPSFIDSYLTVSQLWEGPSVLLVYWKSTFSEQLLACNSISKEEIKPNSNPTLTTIMPWESHCGPNLVSPLFPPTSLPKIQTRKSFHQPCQCALLGTEEKDQSPAGWCSQEWCSEKYGAFG